MSGKPSYSPSEILDMGRRAEAEGNVEYASQFYGYLIEGLPGTREADEARNGMERVARLLDRSSSTQTARPQSQIASTPAQTSYQSPSTAYDHASRTGKHSPQLSMDTATQNARRPTPHQGSMKSGQMRSEPGLSSPNGRPSQNPSHLQSAPTSQTAVSAGQHHPHRGSQPLPQTGRNPVQVNDTHHEDRTPLPKIAQRNDELEEDEVVFVPGYRVGRFLAFALILLGWTAMIGGIAFVAMSIAGVTGTQLLPDYGGLPLGIVAGMSAVVAGIVMIFLGSLAQAAYEAANNTRELLEIERANAGW